MSAETILEAVEEAVQSWPDVAHEAEVSDKKIDSIQKTFRHFTKAS